MYQVHVYCHYPANCKKAAITTVAKKAKTPHPLLASLILSNFLGKLEPTGENYPTWLNTCQGLGAAIYPSSCQPEKSHLALDRQQDKTVNGMMSVF